jgi:hypothetical protein
MTGRALSAWPSTKTGQLKFTDLRDFPDNFFEAHRLLVNHGRAGQKLLATTSNAFRTLVEVHDAVGGSLDGWGGEGHHQGPNMPGYSVDNNLIPKGQSAPNHFNT